jgi:hypothetical protein
MSNPLDPRCPSQALAMPQIRSPTNQKLGLTRITHLTQNGVEFTRTLRNRVSGEGLVPNSSASSVNALSSRC